MNAAGGHKRNSVANDLLVCLAVCVAACMPAQAAEYWEVLEERPPGYEVRTRVATIENDRGSRLQVFRDPEDWVRGVFSLGETLEELDRGCPTLRVDQRRPRSLGFAGARCRLEPKEMHFTLGRVEANETPWQLRQIMVGTRVLFRFRVKGRGYRETEFSLFRSKQALNDAVSLLPTEDEVEQ